MARLPPFRANLAPSQSSQALARSQYRPSFTPCKRSSWALCQPAPGTLAPTAGSRGPLRSGSAVAPLMEGAGTALPTRPDATSSLLGQGSVEPLGVLLTLQVTRPTAHLLSQLLRGLPIPALFLWSFPRIPRPMLLPGPPWLVPRPSQGTWALSCLQGLLSGSALAPCQCCCLSPHLTLEGHLSDRFALDSHLLPLHTHLASLARSSRCLQAFIYVWLPMGSEPQVWDLSTE